MGLQELRRLVEAAKNVNPEDIERLKGRAERVERLLEAIERHLAELVECLCRGERGGKQAHRG